MGILRAIGWTAAGFAGGALLGFVAVSMLSGNTHDKPVELATTAFLMTGPIGAIVGLLAALFTALTRRRKP